MDIGLSYIANYDEAKTIPYSLHEANFENNQYSQTFTSHQYITNNYISRFDID